MRFGKRRNKLMLFRLITSLALVLGGIGIPVAGASDNFTGHALSMNLPKSRYYPETGKTLASEFLRFYDLNGGVLQFGYPLTDARMEKGYLVQWTERQRLEYHPEYSGTEYEVLLGLLGRDLTAGLEGSRFQPEKGSGNRGQGIGVRKDGNSEFSIFNSELEGGSPVTFAETGHSVADPFLSYWRENGGLHVYGYPVSEAFTEKGLLIQWFERARFEYHPEYAEHPVLLGLLGVEGLRRAAETDYTVAISGKSVEDGKLEVDLAQGGESEDPHFLDNVRDDGQDLGPGLVRLDNIYNFYGIVQRGADGSISYDWSRLDVALAGVRAMGKEPMICLSYMPETMSGTGVSRVTPPRNYDEWGALVRATVEHVNGGGNSKFSILNSKLEVENLGFKIQNSKLEGRVRYWEVWNEPDQSSFWLGSYEDYLRLYDVTLAAVKGVDPQARVGGPGVSYLSHDHLRVYLAHENSMVNAGCEVAGQGIRDQGIGVREDSNSEFSILNSNLGVSGGDNSKFRIENSELSPPGCGVAKIGSRVDFLSWHEYGRTPEGLGQDIKRARMILEEFPQFSPELFVTEFNVMQGGSGDTSAGGYTDRVQGAIGVMRGIEVMEREGLDRGFLFELKDGHGPSEYWGRWGVLTNGGERKPVYYALREWAGRPSGRLPVSIVRGAADGTVGVMAYGGGGERDSATIFLWYTGARTQAHVKIGLTDAKRGGKYDLYLFDGAHNNPASGGGAVGSRNDALQKWDTREGGDLDFSLQPESLVIIKLAR